jgi:hypothetical protein
MSKFTKDIDLALQRERFIETARALECDEDETAFKAKLADIGQHTPNDDPKKPAK